MIEVFKTAVRDHQQANILIEEIQHSFSYCRANFDLDDCDKILRVTGVGGEEDIIRIIGIVKNYGFAIEILPDDDAPLLALRVEEEELVDH